MSSPLAAKACPAGPVAALPAELLSLFSAGAEVEPHVNGLLPYPADAVVEKTLYRAA